MTTPPSGPASSGFLGRRAHRWLPVLRLLPRAGLPTVTLTVLFNAALGLLPLGFVYGTSLALDRLPDALGAEGAGWNGVAEAFALALGAFVLQQVLAPFQKVLSELIARRVDGYCVRRLMARSVTEAPLAALEEQRTLNLLSDTRTAFDRVTSTPGDAVAGTLSLLARYAQLAGAVALVGLALGPVAGLLAGVTALVIRFGQRGSLGRFAGLWKGLADNRRELAYLRTAASGPAMAKEIRVLGLIGWFVRRHDAESRAYLDRLWEGRRRILFWPFVGFTLAGLAGGAGVFLILAGAAGEGRLSLLGLALAVQAVLIPMRFGVYFPESDTQTQFGVQAYHSMLEFEQLVSGPAAPPEGGEGPEPTGTVRFEQVDFHYGEAGRPVLRGLDLEIPAGTSTAVVGFNGAGKTTLVKLLTGLYTPVGGRITVGGVEPTGGRRKAWQRRIAAIFQDYVRYELTARDNIVLGAPGRLHGAEAAAAVERAVDRAGAREVVDALPDGLDTVLSGQYEGGQDLSGGQWQRLALARALYAVEAGAELLILDEPTAQLDVRAEVDFFDRFLTTTAGLTSVIISHRFSTVRRADRIVVLEDGRVAEQGSHDELLAAGGRYAELFHLQARRFADRAEDDTLLEATG
ncbi:ABC transporter ATP-binding protein [Streptomyces vietnamensis]|uniref:ABC transporter ATP-binding protein n=1 Tax=Streptomyces vietnamensis TaxID=362257 RepID=UPI0007C6EBAE|nr:ABC transporter ATP-binding protein [Streptomyces vietnamensis]